MREPESCGLWTPPTPIWPKQRARVRGPAHFRVSVNQARTPSLLQCMHAGTTVVGRQRGVGPPSPNYKIHTEDMVTFPKGLSLCLLLDLFLKSQLPW